MNVAEANLFDPCFTSPVNTKAVLCPLQVSSSGEELLEIGLSKLLANRTDGPLTGWAVELPNAVHCRFAGGATFVVGGRRGNYACSDGSWLIGDLQPGEIWLALRIPSADVGIDCA